MDVKGRKKSSNVEDRRGMGAGAIGGGIGGIGLVIVIIFTLLNGGDIGDVVSNITQNGSTQEDYTPTAEEEELAEFVSVVLADTEDVWAQVFKEELGQTYKNPTLVLFTNSVSSGCGMASAAVGPFYCPADYKLYIDLSFYQELKNQFNAPGDFAMAYVVAHEVGHHVQNLLGYTDNVNNLRGKASQEAINAASVRLELQADYLAGVWAHHVQNKGYLEEGDFEEALTAANAIGDDTLQMEAQGYVVPESFTHGTSEQRMRWFKKGFENGTIEGGDTFSVKEL